MRLRVVDKYGRDSSSGHHFMDRDTKKRFDHIIGGISWPGYKPGIAVVFGAVPNVRDYDLQWFGEVEDEDIYEFVEKVLGLQRTFRVQGWRCDTKDKLARSVVNELTEGKRTQLSLLPALRLGEPDRLETYAVRIKKRGKNGTLRFRDKSKYDLPDLNQAELIEARPEDHPFLTALGSVVTDIDNRDPLADMKEERDNSDDYNILTDGMRNPHNDQDWDILRDGLKK